MSNRTTLPRCKLARHLKPGDNILVTRLDHDANISPWMLIAEDRGCNLLWVDIDVEQGTLDLDDFARALEKKPKIAAFGYASNLLGTVNPVKKLTGMAKMPARWCTLMPSSMHHTAPLMCRISAVIFWYAPPISTVGQKQQDTFSFTVRLVIEKPKQRPFG